MRRRVALGSVLMAGTIVAALWWSWTSRTGSAVDFGKWRVVVLQSDDWGFEGWFPDRAAADALADLADDVPPRLRAYARAGLETAAEVESIAVFLSEWTDADGLPAVLQANSILAGPTVGTGESDPRWGWTIHPSGAGPGRYARPGLDAAVDRAIEIGVWWPELHGLTHFDLHAYASARVSDDPIARRARRFDTMAYDGWLQGTELSGSDPDRALRLATEAIDRFRARFGRGPTSVIGPDYRWGAEDEAAWASLGIQAVQAKREQVDDEVDPTDRRGRLEKFLRRQVDRWRGRFVYLDRPARLEPYGDPDLDAAQGAHAAAADVRAAWSRGRPGIVSIHRVQLVSFDPDVAASGRRQLRGLLDALRSDGPVRILVDAEVVQLQRRGWSRIDRGRWRVERNFGEAPVDTGDDGPPLPPGTRARLLRDGSRGNPNSDVNR